MSDQDITKTLSHLFRFFFLCDGVEFEFLKE